MARPASAICDDMLTQKPSGGGQSEKDCREPHRIGGVARAASVGCVVREPRVIRISPTESIEPPVPLRAQARYVLQVTPGSERAMAERVKALAGPELVRDCFALSCRVLRKNQGVWRLVTETMFPGYLFVASDDIEAFEKTIKRSTAFARLLGAERRAFALRPEEAAFVRDFGGPDHVVGFSRGVIENGRTVIDEGPLAVTSTASRRSTVTSASPTWISACSIRSRSEWGWRSCAKPDRALRSLNQLAARSSTDRRRRRNPSFDLPAGNCMRLYGRDRTYFDARKRCRVCVSPASKG